MSADQRRGDDQIDRRSDLEVLARRLDELDSTAGRLDEGGVVGCVVASRVDPPEHRSNKRLRRLDRDELGAIQGHQLSPVAYPLDCVRYGCAGNSTVGPRLYSRNDSPPKTDRRKRPCRIVDDDHVSALRDRRQASAHRLRACCAPDDDDISGTSAPAVRRSADPLRARTALRACAVEDCVLPGRVSGHDQHSSVADTSRDIKRPIHDRPSGEISELLRRAETPSTPCGNHHRPDAH